MKFAPEAGRVDDGAARLITMATLDEFLVNQRFSESADTPVWLVGYESFARDSLMPVLAESVATPRPAPPGVIGAYFAVTANDGELLVAGPLFSDPSDGSPTLSALRALVSEQLLIVTPSPGPTFGPVPNVTRDPNDRN